MFRRGRSPWWSSSDGSGRFDLPVPRGTCYLAEERLGSLLEVARGLTLLSETFLSGRQLLTTWPTRPLRLADLSAAAAYGYGVAGELSATPDYTAPRAWARALQAAGFAGIRYRSATTPGASSSASPGSAEPVA